MSTLQRRILERLSAELRPHGFMRRGNLLVRDEEEVSSVVELEYRQEHGCARFTLAVGAWSRDLARLAPGGRTASRASDCHWGGRLGVVSQRGDRWWSVCTEDETDSACAEALTMFFQVLTTTLNSIRSNDDLLRTLESGHTPGVTQFQRLLYVMILRRRGAEAEFEASVEDLLDFAAPRGLKSTAESAISRARREVERPGTG